MWFSNMFKLVQNQYIWYELIQFLNMSRLEMKTWRNTLKLSKWHGNLHWHWKSYSLDRFEQVERSKTDYQIECKCSHLGIQMYLSLILKTFSVLSLLTGFERFQQKPGQICSVNLQNLVISWSKTVHRYCCNNIALKHFKDFFVKQGLYPGNRQVHFWITRTTYLLSSIFPFNSSPESLSTFLSVTIVILQIFLLLRFSFYDFFSALFLWLVLMLCLYNSSSLFTLESSIITICCVHFFLFYDFHFTNFSLLFCFEKESPIVFRVDGRVDNRVDGFDK